MFRPLLLGHKGLTTQNIQTTKIYILQMQATHWSNIQRNET
jgi:hypothetical protein